MNDRTVTAVVVTYNRRSLLEKCLIALSKQTTPPGRMLVVDNASSDGTSEWLRSWLPANLPNCSLLVKESNTGGAGGFCTGLELACKDGAGWTWMMDDDACPHPTALEELLNVAESPQNVYGSLAVSGVYTSWATTLLDSGRIVQMARDVPDIARVEFIPLLGLLVHSSLVRKIGFPDAGFFIAADDVEFCMRARRANAELIIAGKSRIEHPRTLLTDVFVFGKRIPYLSLPPWKRYYDTRNRLLVARRYHGIRLVTQTVPGTFVRLIAALRKEPAKFAQLWAFCAGMIDGMCGITGRRHAKWGLRQ